MTRRTFLFDAAYNMLASATVSLGTLVISIFCTRTFGAEVFGRYALALSFVAPIFLLGGFNARQLISSYSGAHEARQDIAGARAIGLAISFAACITLSAYFYYNIGSFAAHVMLLVAFAKLIEAAAEGSYGWLAHDRKFKDIAIRKILRAVASAIAFVGISWVCESFLAGLVGMVFVSLCLYLVNERSESDVNLKIPHKAIVSIALASGFAAFLDSFAANMPRIMLGLSGSFTAVAHLSAIMQIPVLLAIVVGGVGNAAIPRWRSFTNRTDLLKDVALIQCAIASMSICLCLASFAIGDLLIEGIYGRDFRGLGVLLSAFSIGSAFWYASGINGCALQARSKYRWQLLSTFTAAISVATLALIFYWVRDNGITVEDAVIMYDVAMAIRFIVSGAGVVRFS